MQGACVKPLLGLILTLGLLTGCSSVQTVPSCAEFDAVQPGYDAMAAFQPPHILQITEFPGTNYSQRREQIDMLVLHYTGMQTGEGARRQLSRAGSGVSSHYLVMKDGTIYRLVPEHFRAWHAGKGSWAGRKDINSRSIGIEIVNGGHEFGLPAFPREQIDAVIALSRDIIARHDIPAGNIIGHSDMAPNRKEDPGERFPWRRLADAGVGLYPDLDVALAQDALSRGRYPDALVAIGYDFDDAGGVTREQAVTAFQRRWCPATPTGRANIETRQLIGAVQALYAQ